MLALSLADRAFNYAFFQIPSSLFGRIWACYGAHFLFPLSLYDSLLSFVYGFVYPSGGVHFIAVPLVGSAFCFRSKQDRQPR